MSPGLCRSCGGPGLRQNRYSKAIALELYRSCGDPLEVNTAVPFLGNGDRAGLQDVRWARTISLTQFSVGMRNISMESKMPSYLLLVFSAVLAF